MAKKLNDQQSSDLQKAGKVQLGSTGAGFVGIADAGTPDTDRGHEGGLGRASPAAHPTVLAKGADGECPPINKMGETFQDSRADLCTVQLVMSDGKVKPVMVRQPVAGQIAHVDWVNFTVHEDTFSNHAGQQLFSDDDYIRTASRILEKIFGFGIVAQREKGMNFYQTSFVLGDKFGAVCYGGQRQTMQITINGQGCLNAAEGWEQRLHDFLTDPATVRPVITRLDLAHDDFDGVHTVDFFEAQWAERGFSCSFGDLPNIELKGNWHKPNGKGRTLCIGLRTSGKYARFYEKGRAEGCKHSPWVRAEIEFKSSDIVIPFSALVDPSAFFSAAYPVLSVYGHVQTPRRMEVKAKAAEITVDRSYEVIQTQFGKYLNVLRQLSGSDSELLDRLCHPDPEAWPERLKVVSASLETCPVPVHREPSLHDPEFDYLAASLATRPGEYGFKSGFYPFQ